VDQAGSLLNSPDENAEAAASSRQFEQTRKLEESLQQRIVELPGPVTEDDVASLRNTLNVKLRDRLLPAARRARAGRRAIRSVAPAGAAVARPLSIVTLLVWGLWWCS